MKFVSKIQVAGTDETREAQVFPCDDLAVTLWHRKIHTPYIAPGGGLDASWHWPRIVLGTSLSELALGRRALAYQLRVEGPGGNAVPVAQALYSVPYYYPGDLRRRCVFVWYISAAPAAALAAQGVHERFALMGPLLDMAIQLSVSYGLEGRIGLHAATGKSAKQNAALVQRYLDQGLTQRVKTSKYFSRPARKDDGKFFYFTEAQAASYASKYDCLRSADPTPLPGDVP